MRKSLSAAPTEFIRHPHCIGRWLQAAPDRRRTPSTAPVAESKNARQWDSTQTGKAPKKIKAK